MTWLTDLYWFATQRTCMQRFVISGVRIPFYDYDNCQLWSIMKLQVGSKSTMPMRGIYDTGVWSEWVRYLFRNLKRKEILPWVESRSNCRACACIEWNLNVFGTYKNYTRPCDRRCTKRPPSIKRPVFKVSIFGSYKRWNAGANII